MRNSEDHQGHKPHPQSLEERRRCARTHARRRLAERAGIELTRAASRRLSCLCRDVLDQPRANRAAFSRTVGLTLLRRDKANERRCHFLWLPNVADGQTDKRIVIVYDTALKTVVTAWPIPPGDGSGGGSVDQIEGNPKAEVTA